MSWHRNSIFINFRRLPLRFAINTKRNLKKLIGPNLLQTAPPCKGQTPTELDFLSYLHTYVTVLTFNAQYLLRSEFPQPRPVVSFRLAEFVDLLPY
jgi:hypothetical protein